LISRSDQPSPSTNPWSTKDAAGRIKSFYDLNLACEKRRSRGKLGM
jgi:hypothetical protein